MSATPRQLRLRVTSDPANLAPVRHDLEAFCLACGFDECTRGEIVLCVNEAMANITRHAYRGAKDQPIEINAHFAEQSLRVTVRDWGSGATPPSWIPERDPLQVGGVGMICLRKLMDTITFTPQPDGMLLTMERHL